MNQQTAEIRLDVCNLKRSLVKKWINYGDSLS